VLNDVTCIHIQVLGQQAYLTRQVVLFAVSFFDMQRPKRRSIAILGENETTEQISDETAQQVSERKNGDMCKCQQNNYLVSVVCV
jgi:hypothetical protein